MAWARLDDKRALHRKFRRQGFAVRGLDEAAITYSAHEETDGFITDDALEDLAHHHGLSLKATIALAKTLVDIKRWARHDDEGAWEVLGYLEFNPSHTELEAARRKTGSGSEARRIPAGFQTESTRIPNRSHLQSAGTGLALPSRPTDSTGRENQKPCARISLYQLQLVGRMVVNSDECGKALKAVHAAFPYQPMSDVQRRQFERLFAGYQPEPLRAVLDDLIRLGIKSRPGPAEMGELLRSKVGRDPAGQRVHRDGPYLDASDPSITPREEISERIAELRELAL